MLDTRHEYRALEEAILGVIGSMDKPSSPAGRPSSAYNRLFGRPRHARTVPRRILAVLLDDLRRVAERYLTPGQASTAVVTGAGLVRQRCAGGPGTAGTVGRLRQIPSTWR